MSVVPAEALVLKLQPPKWLLGPVLGSLRAARASSPVHRRVFICDDACGFGWWLLCAERPLAFSCLWGEKAVEQDQEVAQHEDARQRALGALSLGLRTEPTALCVF